MAGTLEPASVQSGQGAHAALVDTHIHLDFAAFDPDRSAVIKAARECGVDAFVVPGTNAQNMAAQIRLAASEEDIFLAFGIHPLYVDSADDSELETLQAALKKTVHVVAIGEIGLDGFRGAPDLARQQHFFRAQLKLAQTLGLPVIIHARHATEAVLQSVRQFDLNGGIIHAFNGSLQQAQKFIERGFKLGFGGAMTYNGSKRIRTLAATLPLEALVLETDAPDIPPAWAAGQRTEPAWLYRYAQELAKLRQTPIADIIAHTTRNAHAALPAIRGDGQTADN